MKQTAVEWLEEMFSNSEIPNSSMLFKQAKEMEKAEKIKAKIQGLYLASTDAIGISYRISELEEELKSLTFKSK
jgi:hypothetical protein